MFSKYLVIFVDLLGSQNRSDFQELYEINGLFHEEMKNQQNMNIVHPNVVYERKVFSFSDCAYIFYSFKKDIEDSRKDLGKLFTTALCNSEPLFIKFLSRRMLFRGGITYGDAYVDSEKDMFFGEAVNRAYQLESKMAIHPRILIDDCVADIFNKNVEKSMGELVSKQGEEIAKALEHLAGKGLIGKDFDEKNIFNYFHSIENNVASIDCPNCEEFLWELIEHCNSQINKINDYKVLDKYFYLKRFAAMKLRSLVNQPLGIV